MKGRKLIVRHRGSVGSTCRVLYFLEYNVLLDKSRVATADVQGDPILKDSSFYRRFYFYSILPVARTILELRSSNISGAFHFGGWQKSVRCQCCTLLLFL